jgi:hypothetical protein
VEAATIICRPGDQSPLCPPEELNQKQDLASQGNGAARPAVSKDAQSGDNGVYKAAYVNDGREGAAWVSDSAYSWIKIDLGRVTTINTVSLDKASFNSHKNHKLGQFVIAVALSDVYVDGNSSNDYTEYTEVYDSEETGFSGVISDSETVSAMFKPIKARFVKITFENPGTAINEVNVFMVQPVGWTDYPTRKPTDAPPQGMVSTPIPVYNTSVPADTAIPAPTDTAIPAPTRTPVPTDPPPPTNTPVPRPTRTPVPTDPPPPTEIPPTDVPPTDVPPTDIPPADTPVPPPVDTISPANPTAEAETSPTAGP